MTRPHKIKHYHRHNGVYKAKPHPLNVIICILGVSALVFVGISCYQPLYNLVTGNHSFFSPTEEEDTAIQQPDADIPVLPVEVIDEEQEVIRNEISDVMPEYRSVYLPPYIVSDSAALGKALDTLPTGTDTVMIDLKDNAGAVLFDSKNPNAAAWNAVSENAVNLSSLAQELDGRGIKLIGRMTAFRDEIASRGNRSNAIRYQNGDWLWYDNAAELGGKPWLNPMSEGARQYLIDLAVEAVHAGVSLIVMDSVQFANYSNSQNATFGEEATAARRKEALKLFVTQAEEAIKSAGGFLAVYYQASEIAKAVQESDWEEGNGRFMPDSVTCFGGNPLDIVGDNLVLGVLPYQFAAAEFEQGGLKIKDPAQDPVATVRAMVIYVEQIADEDITIIPLMQGWLEPGMDSISYTGELVQSKINAVLETSAAGYVLYQTQGNYQ